MKKNITIAIFLFLLALSGGYSEAKAQDTGAQFGYGFSIGNSVGLVSFELNGFSPTFVWTHPYRVSAGTFAEGYYYAARVNGDGNPVGMYAYDIKTGDSKEIFSMEGAPSILTDMTYDYTTNTLYAIADDYPETALMKINLKEKKLEYINNFEYVFFTLAADNNGDLYSMTSDGSIYKLSKSSAEVELISEGSDYLNGLQSMDYDFNSGKFYWLTTRYANCRLVEITPGTWERNDIGSVGSSQITGLFTGYTAALPTSPASPLDLIAHPAENGEISCRLEWTNPTLTFERQQLEGTEMTVNIYRNGTRIATIDNAVAGQKMEYTDNASQVGTQKYRVALANEYGEGMFTDVYTYVGPDIPTCPTNINAIANGNEITITWDAPTGSVHNGWFDKDRITYKVLRNNDNKVIVENLQETTVKDNIDGDYAGYVYTVTPIVPAGEGESAESNVVFAGMPSELPLETSFTSDDELNTGGWVTIDQDGSGSSWVISDRLGKGLGAEAYLNKSYDASDWLISAPVSMTEGEVSEIMFDVYTAYYPKETLELYFGTSTNPEDFKLVKSLTVSGGYYSPVKVQEMLPAAETNGIYYLGIRYASPKNTYSGYGVHINNLCWKAVKEGTVKGVVSCNDIPLEGITVNMGEYLAVTTSDGEYMFERVEAGSYTISVNTTGYRLSEKDITVSIGSQVTCDFALEELPKYKLGGTICDSEGNPITGAVFSLDGYASFSATSDNSVFALNDVYEGSYTLTVKKNNFVTYSEDIVVNDNKDFSITLDYDNIAPFYVKAEYDGEMTSISWGAPVSVNELSYDNGVPEKAMSYGSDELAVFGSIYRTPAIVREVKWMTLPVEGNNDGTNIYIFALDEEGNPTDRILFSAMDVPTEDNQWNTYHILEKVVAENGFILAVSSNSGARIAVDNGQNNDIKNNRNTQCYNINYRAYYDYRFMDDTSTPDACFLLRAVCENIEPENATKPNVEYKLWRVKADDTSIADETTWFELADGTKELSATDALAPSGSYVYAVKAVYPVGKLISQPTFSSVININTDATVTVNVTANSDAGHANGASVTLSNENNSYKAVVSGNKVVFENVAKGKYQIDINLNGFESIKETCDIEGEDKEFNFEFVLNQKLDIAQNVYIQPTDKPENWNLMWNIQPNLKENFDGEDYQDFEVNPKGNIGWMYIDNDNKETYGFGNTIFPHMREKMAAITFNSSATTPPLGVNTAYSGERNLAFFAAKETVNEVGGIVINESDDYLISPMLHPFKDFKFSFYACTYEESSGYRERIRVGYSETTPEIENIIWLDDDYFYVPLEYTKYEYLIPANAKYVVLNSHSISNFILLVDDIFIGVDDLVEGCEYAPVNVEKYNIYLDGKLVAETTENSFMLENVPEGKHEAAVTQVFATGESAKLGIDFVSAGSNLDNAVTVDTYAYVSNRILYIEGQYENAEVCNTAGVKVADISGKQTADVSFLSDGIYLVKIETDNGVRICKVILE